MTKDIKRRLREHNHTSRGARYTRSRRPVELIYVETHEGKGKALSAEYAFKRMKRADKLIYVLKKEGCA